MAAFPQELIKFPVAQNQHQGYHGHSSPILALPGMAVMDFTADRAGTALPNCTAEEIPTSLNFSAETESKELPHSRFG